MILVPLKGVTLKMLPFDNKSELQVMIDMPEGSTLEETAALATGDGRIPEDRAGGDRFSVLCRHRLALQLQRTGAPLLSLRPGSNQADIQVNFVGKGERKAQSHDIAKRLAPRNQEDRRPLSAQNQGGGDPARARRC